MAIVAIVAAVGTVVACAIAIGISGVFDVIAHVISGMPIDLECVNGAISYISAILLWGAIMAWIVLAECRTAIPGLKTWLPQMALWTSVVGVFLLIIHFGINRIIRRDR